MKLIRIVIEGTDAEIDEVGKLLYREIEIKAKHSLPHNGKLLTEAKCECIQQDYWFTCKCGDYICKWCGGHYISTSEVKK